MLHKTIPRYSLIRGSIIFLSLLILFFTHPFFLKAYFAEFLLETPAAQPAVVPFETYTAPITVSYAPAEQSEGGVSEYIVDRKQICNEWVFDEVLGEDTCVDGPPNLCPYLSLTPQENEATEQGFPYNPNFPYDSALGKLEHTSDTTDQWQLAVKPTCFEGECPADYNSNHYGPPLDPGLKNQVFQCRLVVESNFIVPVLLPGSKAFAGGPAKEITVSATLPGIFTVNTLTLSLPEHAPFQSDGVDPNMGTADSTPFEFKVLATDSSNTSPSIKLMLSDGVTTAQYEMSADPDAEPELRDGNLANGEIYMLAKQLPIGSYTYHFESGIKRLPESGDYSVQAGLLMTPKASANIRNAPGTSGTSIINNVPKGKVIEVFPLCSVANGGECNDDSAVYQLIDNHYWLKVSFEGTIGYIAEDFLMTITPKSQPARVARLIQETREKSEYENLKNFPTEVLLAMTAFESGGTLNNEITSIDSPFGGIKQVHPSKSGGWNRNCKENEAGQALCTKNNINWNNLNYFFKDIFNTSINQYNNIAYQWKNYINTEYSNTDVGLTKNIEDGLSVLQSKLMGVQCKNNPSIPNTIIDGIEFNCVDKERIKGVWAYNGWNPPGETDPERNKYLVGIADRLETLHNYFPRYLTTIEESELRDLAKKLRVAHTHKTIVKKFSPVYLRVVDIDGNITGEVDGIVKNEVEDTVYDPETESVAIFFPESKIYTYEVEAYEIGTYGLEIDTISGEIETSFYVPDMLVTAIGEMHQYTVNTKALSENKPGVTVKIDKEGDGTFEKTLSMFANGTIAADTVAPVTTAAITGTAGTNGWYTSTVTVTLAAADNEGGSGVKEVQYSFDSGSTWNTYFNSVPVTKEGVTAILYRSIDNTGNSEAPKTLVLKIDKTSPEAAFTFDPVSKKIKINGTDTLSSTTVAQTSTAATVSDEAGNKIKLTYIKVENLIAPSVLVKSLQYNNVPVVIPVKNILFFLPAPNIPLLVEHGFIYKQIRITGYYNKLKNQTILFTEAKSPSSNESQYADEKKAIKEVKSGLVLLKLTTNKGNLHITY